MREETTVDTRRVASGNRWKSTRGTTKQLRDIRGKRQHDEREPRSKEPPHAQLVGVARANVSVIFGHSSCGWWPAPRITVFGKWQRCAHSIATSPTPSSTLAGTTGTTTECRSVQQLRARPYLLPSAIKFAKIAKRTGERVLSLPFLFPSVPWRNEACRKWRKWSVEGARQAGKEMIGRGVGLF